MTKNELFDFEDEKDIRIIRIQLMKAGAGGYIIKVQQIPHVGKMKSFIKRYPKKTLGTMHPIVKDVIEEMKVKGMSSSRIAFDSSMMRMNLTY